jgi:hypothetical protein
MRLQYFAVAGLAACLFAATPVLAQSKTDGAKSDTQTTTQQPAGDDASDQDPMGATKQHTQAGANFRPPEYGTPYKDRQEGFKQ